MRRLAIGDRGTDVVHLQKAINNRSRARHLPTLHVDGLFGRETRKAAERVARALGAREDTIARRPLTIGVQRMIRWPALRTPVQLARARERAKQPAHNGGAGDGSFGVDYAWGTPDYLALRKAGVRFACRYLSHDKGKNLTAAEAKQLAAHGIDCVVVWETTANRALAGRAAGQADAREADRQAKLCRMPAGRPIYFAVDFDATVQQQPAINAYFEGVASVLGKHRVGVYGGLWPVRRLLAAKLVTYAWQTYAWSGGAWEDDTHLRQYSNGHTLAGVSCDYNRATAGDFGQWRPA